MADIPPRYEKPPKIPPVKNKNIGVLPMIIALGITTALVGAVVWLNIVIWSNIF